MKEILENIANTLGWEYHYARKDFQNLASLSASANATYLFVEPVEWRPQHNSIGSFTSWEFNGSFVVVIPSILDAPYSGSENAKYESAMRDRIRSIAHGAFHHELTCTHDIEIVSLTILEIVNVLSENFDGILVNYTFRSLNRNL